MNRIRLFLVHVLIGIFSCVYLTACKEAGDDEKDVAPMADAAIIGATNSSDASIVRGGSVVLVTGKDSDGIDDPLMDFEIEAVDVAGDDALTIESVNRLLFERTVNTKAFFVPSVSEDSEVTFQVTVEDADGVRASDRVTLNVLSIGDGNAFLTQAAVSNPNVDKYELVVALDLEEGEVTNSSFEVEISTIAQWKPRSAHPECIFGDTRKMCRLLLSTQAINGEWPSGIDYDEARAGNPIDSINNPHFWIQIPAIDVDEINRNFVDSNREKRLELADVGSATVFHQYRFIRSDNNAKLLIPNSGVLNHRFSVAGTAPSDLVNVDLIRSTSGSESALSAWAYYELVDPEMTARTLDGWLMTRGFAGESTHRTIESAHAIYLNNYDLGFGRDMFIRTDDCGNVYSYVENYPSLETAIKKQNNFATVVMEYSPIVQEQPGTCSNAEKIVKFFAYVPDDSSGQRVLMPTMNFDGRGEKALPGVCTACHGGSSADLRQFVGEFVAASGYDKSKLTTAIKSLSDADKLRLADLNATFMPFDIDSFLFTNAQDSKLVDPFYGRSDLTTAQISAYSLDAQLGEFRVLNKAVLRTYLHKQQGLGDDEAKRRWDAPIALVNSWYGTSISGLQGIDAIDVGRYDGQAVLPGWLEQTQVYHDVFARYCRACHIQLENTALNFDTAHEFFDSETPDSSRLQNIVFGRGAMPLARLTMDRFWVDFYGNTSGADLLKTHLGLDASLAPGPISADFVIDSATPNVLGQTVSMEASILAPVDVYDWHIENDCGSAAFLYGATIASAKFVTDVSPCRYTVTLNASNRFGSDSITKTIVMDRFPEGANFDADMSNFLIGSSSLVIDIQSELARRSLSRGDNDENELLEVVLPDESNNLSISLLGNGRVSLTVPPLSALDTSFLYRVRDADGSESPSYQIQVNKGAIRPLLSTPSAGRAEVGFAIAMPGNVQVGSYIVERKNTSESDAAYRVVSAELPRAGNSTAFLDTAVESNQSYTYRVRATLDDDVSAYSESLALSTTSGEPTAELSGAPTANSITVILSIPDGSVPESLELFRVNPDNSESSVPVSLGQSVVSDSGLVPNMGYRYFVRANYDDLSVDSVDSEVIGPIYTMPATPSSFASSDVDRTTTSLTFNLADSNNAAGNGLFYRIFVNGGLWRDVGSGTFTITGLDSYTTYSVVVRAISNSGSSADLTASGNRRTKVTTDSIGSLVPVGQASTCSACHIDFETRARRPCVTDNNSLSDCTTSMPYTLTNDQVNRIRDWMLDFNL